jgi:4-azaleucine resistance transporter AzlC
MLDPPGSASREAPQRAFLEGLRDITPIIIATIPFGIIFGALGAQQGLTLNENVLMSGLVFAGASQFVALELWAHPLPFWSILLSVLAVNLRLVLYSAALGRKMAHWPPLQLYAGLGLLTDPAYALAERRYAERVSAGYYFGITVPLYVNWVVTTGIGAIFGNLIPDPALFGLDFVVTAYFIHMIAGFRSRPNAGAVVLASAAVSVAIYLSFGPPWHFAAGAAAGMAAAVALVRPGSAAA